MRSPTLSPKRVGSKTSRMERTPIGRQSPSTTGAALISSASKASSAFIADSSGRSVNSSGFMISRTALAMALFSAFRVPLFRDRALHDHPDARGRSAPARVPEA
jgi:hypothetical protein